MKLATPNQTKKIDAIAINQYKIPGILLMDNAAFHIAQKAREMVSGKRIIVVSGKGNNGGDAFAAARYLFQWGYSVIVYSLVCREDISGDAATFLQIIENVGIKIVFFTDDEQAFIKKLSSENGDLIIDGIFGTGIRGNVSGIFAKAIETICQSNIKVLSIDIPSGINGETGQVCGVAVKADETVTFSLPKLGLCQYPGVMHAGKLTVVDIGIPSQIFNQLEISGELLDREIVYSFLPKRPQDGHKGDFGKLMIITGSTGMIGAGTLAARAAFKTGSGLVYLAVPKTLENIYNTVIPEAITIPLDDDDGAIVSENLESLIGMSDSMDAVIIGPGLSAKPQIGEWVNDFIVKCKKPMVIDADALNKVLPQVINNRGEQTVITPHPGEFSRLTGIPTEEIKKSRVETALYYSKQWNVTIVLKGAGTVIAHPDGTFCINLTGHSGMAVAGSGDVLSGIIGSFIGQKVSCKQAAALGVYIHGCCGELLARKNSGQAGFLASELCNEIPTATANLAEYI